MCICWARKRVITYMMSAKQQHAAWSAQSQSDPTVWLRVSHARGTFNIYELGSALEQHRAQHRIASMFACVIKSSICDVSYALSGEQTPQRNAPHRTAHAPHTFTHATRSHAHTRTLTPRVASRCAVSSRRANRVVWTDHRLEITHSSVLRSYGNGAG